MAKLLNGLEQALVASLTFNQESYQTAVSANDLMIKRTAYVKSTFIDIVRLYKKEVKNCGLSKDKEERLLGVMDRCFSLTSQALAMALVGAMASVQIKEMESISTEGIVDARYSFDNLLLSIAHLQMKAKLNPELDTLIAPVVTDALRAFDAYPKVFAQAMSLDKSNTQLSPEASQTLATVTANADELIVRSLIGDATEKSLGELVAKVKSDVEWYKDATLTLAHEGDDEEEEEN